ncbi:MAG: hypothetical protein CME70_07430 [Halobacteriovorax sp.]|nr:hypothetical protein [Halobacteriovorax sp.]
MVKMIPLLMLLTCFSVNAESSKTVLYEGQQFESLELKNKKVETRYREEEVDDTCTRQIPYTVNECGYETRYRTECRTVPGYQDCRTVQDRTCRNVTRYRRECRNVGGGQTCRTVPGRRQCRTLPNGTQRCRQLPSHRVCTDKPPRRECRDVPYTDRVCTTTPRRQCDWIPSRRVCEDVPYQEHVCRDVTRYRTEEYACRRTIQVPYQVVAKLFDGKIDVQFKESNLGVSKANLNFELDSEGKVSLKVEDLSENAALILGKKKVEAEDQGDTLAINALYKINFLDMNKILAPIKKQIGEFYLNETYLSFVMGKVLKPEGIKVSVNITRKDKTILSKTLEANEYKLRDHEGNTKLSLDLKQFDIDLRRREHSVTVDVEMKFNDLILNSPSPLLKNTRTVKIKAVKD